MKIQAIRKNEIDEESESHSFQAKWSQSKMSQISSVQICRPPMVQKFYSSHLKTWLPWSLHPSHKSDPPDPEVQAVGDLESDIRPHIFDPVLKKFILCDSGSQVSAFPPDPGDKPVSNHFLKAANGSRMACFGYKDITIKIGQKDYPFKIIKAEVESPIIGWDFMSEHKLDLRWNKEDKITIYDRKSKLSSILHFKPVPKEQSALLKNLSLVEAGSGHLGQEIPSRVENPEILLGEMSSIEALGEDDVTLDVHDEDINILPDSPYQQLLSRFPGLMKQNFHEEPTKSNIIHRIHTNGPPIKSKVRRLLPGSEKAKLAKKAWDELIHLGIVEKVAPKKIFF